jgi:fucokinase
VAKQQQQRVDPAVPAMTPRHSQDGRTDDIRAFPFAVVVLSFPDARAQVAAEGAPFWKDLQLRYPLARFVATTDPYGCRVGSGGGTLQALSAATDDDSANDGMNDSSSTSRCPSILILHAGGQSSRCPTQMCLGKAATTFPTAKDPHLVTPVHHWLSLAARLFVGLPVGTVVVLAGDTLLRLPDSSPDGSSLSSSTSCSLAWSVPAEEKAAVVVLTVPAPLATAQNHGVFCLEEDDNETDHSEPSADNGQEKRRLTGCRRVLQKPSLDVLRREVVGADQPNDATATAWIDTGVLVFLPPAAQVLWALTRETCLYGCTARGLQELHRQQAQHARPQTPVEELATPSSLPTNANLASFALLNAVSIDLYTHILQALTLTTGRMTWETYYDRFRNELSTSVARALYKHLAPLELRLWPVSQGRFLHLGTTRELLDFYLESTKGTTSVGQKSLLALFAQDLGLQARKQLVLSSDSATVDCHTDSVLYHSVLFSRNTISVGKGSLVEFVTLVNCPRTIEIGQDCWISGVRGHVTQSLRIPDGMVVQELSLSEKTRVYLVLGVDDPIKAASALYGRPLGRVMEATGLTPHDLWAGRDPKDHTLWHAMLHPVLRSDEEGSCYWPQLFDWLSHLDSPDEFLPHPSLAAWRQRERLSLADIRQRADARMEFAYRESVKNHGLPSARLRIRQEVLVRIPRFQESTREGNSLTRQLEVRASWQKLYDTLISWLRFDMYDMLGSAAMQFATCWDECAHEGSPLCSKTQATRDTLIQASELVERREAFASEYIIGHLQQLVSVANDSIGSLSSEGAFSTEECRSMARLFQSAVSVCTRVCVGAAAEDPAPIATVPIFNSFVLATAPVRIDLAGGWTDTPPICYEHGSVGKLHIGMFQKPFHARH